MLTVLATDQVCIKYLGCCFTVRAGSSVVGLHHRHKDQGWDLGTPLEGSRDTGPQGPRRQGYWLRGYWAGGLLGSLGPSGHTQDHRAMGLLGSLTQQVQGPQRPGQQKFNVLFGTEDYWGPY